MASFRWYIGASFTALLIAVAALAVARSSAEGVRDARLLGVRADRGVPALVNRTPHALFGFALVSSLALPLPGTDSRDRAFCRPWLALSAVEKRGVVVAAERSEAGFPAGAACREGLRPGLRQKLDSECRNWTLLMDFEVRAVVDGVLEPCGRPRA